MLSLICGPGSRSRVFFLATHLRLLIGPSDSNKMLFLRTWVGGDLFPTERSRRLRLEIRVTIFSFFEGTAWRSSY